MCGFWDLLAWLCAWKSPPAGEGPAGRVAAAGVYFAGTAAGALHVAGVAAGEVYAQ